jgi:hypothetical protein
MTVCVLSVYALLLLQLFRVQHERIRVPVS